MHSMKRDNVKCNVKFCVIICLDLKDGLKCTKVIPVVEFLRWFPPSKIFGALEEPCHAKRKVGKKGVADISWT